MALKYHLVQRLDKSKDAAAGSKLYFGQIRAQQKLEFNKLCEIIASYSTASRGDVMLTVCYTLCANIWKMAKWSRWVISVTSVCWLAARGQRLPMISPRVCSKRVASFSHQVPC